MRPGALAVPIGVSEDVSFFSLATAIGTTLPSMQALLFQAQNALAIKDVGADHNGALFQVAVDQGHVMTPGNAIPDYYGVRDVTGGYVYRGTASPALSGVYLYADYCSGMLWGLRAAAAGEWEQTVLLKTGRQVSSFGQDDAGEIYLIDLKGNIYHIEQTVQGRSQFRQLLPLVGRDG